MPPVWIPSMSKPLLPLASGTPRGILEPFPIAVTTTPTGPTTSPQSLHPLCALWLDPLDDRVVEVDDDRARCRSSLQVCSQRLCVLGRLQLGRGLAARFMVCKLYRDEKERDDCACVDSRYQNP